VKRGSGPVPGKPRTGASNCPQEPGILRPMEGQTAAAMFSRARRAREGRVSGVATPRRHTTGDAYD